MFYVSSAPSVHKAFDTYALFFVKDPWRPLHFHNVRSCRNNCSRSVAMAKLSQKNRNGISTLMITCINLNQPPTWNLQKSAWLGGVCIYIDPIYIYIRIIDIDRYCRYPRPYNEADCFYCFNCFFRINFHINISKPGGKLAWHPSAQQTASESAPLKGNPESGQLDNFASIFSGAKLLLHPGIFTWNLRIRAPWRKIIWTKPSFSGSMSIFGEVFRECKRSKRYHPSSKLLAESHHRGEHLCDTNPEN